MAISRQGILAYCSSSMGFVLINSVFSFYYVKVFMNIYNIDRKWFQIAQILYLVWNAINDPLFAYIQDSTNITITKTRRESILYCGPLFCIAFVIPWIPWDNNSWVVGLHLIVALFLWDTMYTFVGLAMASLFTELSQEPEDRIALIRYSQIASLLGSPSVMLMEFMSNSLHNIFAFQITSVLIAFCAALLFRFTGLYAHTKYDLQKMKTNGDNASISHEKTMDESYWTQAKQILSDRNFIAFVATNFCHQFHNTFINNFMAIICDQLVPENVIAASTRKTVYGGLTIISALIVIFGSPLIERFSYTNIIRYSYICTICGGIVMFYIGQEYPVCLLLLILYNGCVTTATFSLFNMPLADISDDNKAKYKRKHPISSMIFGTNALITKPAISLSPMLTAAVLNLYGYHDLTNKTKGASPELKQAMFYLVCLYPIVLGVIQFISWSFFRIKRK